MVKKSDLTDNLGSPFDKETLMCHNCGVECSANKADYWDIPDDYEFTCDPDEGCGEPLDLVRKKVIFEKVKLPRKRT